MELTAAEKRHKRVSESEELCEGNREPTRQKGKSRMAMPIELPCRIALFGLPG